MSTAAAFAATLALWATIAAIYAHSASERAERHARRLGTKLARLQEMDTELASLTKAHQRLSGRFYQQRAEMAADEPSEPPGRDSLRAAHLPRTLGTIPKPQ